MKTNEPTSQWISAFPYVNSLSASSGMSLRDYFASKALQGLVTNGNIPYNKMDVAKVCYEYADAMIKMRGEL